LTQKISVTNYISIISKNAWQFLVDSNVFFFVKHSFFSSIFSFYKKTFVYLQPNKKAKVFYEYERND